MLWLLTCRTATCCWRTSRLFHCCIHLKPAELLGGLEVRGVSHNFKTRRFIIVEDAMKLVTPEGLAGIQTQAEDSCILWWFVGEATMVVANYPIYVFLGKQLYLFFGVTTLVVVDYTIHVWTACLLCIFRLHIFENFDVTTSVMLLWLNAMIV